MLHEYFGLLASALPKLYFHGLLPMGRYLFKCDARFFFFFYRRDLVFYHSSVSYSDQMLSMKEGQMNYQIFNLLLLLRPIKSYRNFDCRSISIKHFSYDLT